MLRHLRIVYIVLGGAQMRAFIVDCFMLFYPSCFTSCNEHYSRKKERYLTCSAAVSEKIRSFTCVCLCCPDSSRNVTPHTQVDFKVWSHHTLKADALLGKATLDLIQALEQHDRKCKIKLHHRTVSLKRDVIQCLHLHLLCSSGECEGGAEAECGAERGSGAHWGADGFPTWTDRHRPGGTGTAYQRQCIKWHQ